MIHRRLLIVLALLAVPLISGSQCAFIFSSGGGSDDDEDAREGLTVVVSSGRFIDSPVEGLRYQSGSISGITDENGEFRYEAGSTIRFFIGDIQLGDVVDAKELITPLDLVADGKLDSTAVINIARLLQSLDAQPGDGIITIPDAVHAAAARSNEVVAPAIEFLTFADNPIFANAASQLVTVLTNDYPFTAVLVDAETAREHLAQSLVKLRNVDI